MIKKRLVLNVIIWLLLTTLLYLMMSFVSGGFNLPTSAKAFLVMVSTLIIFPFTLIFMYDAKKSTINELYDIVTCVKDTILEIHCDKEDKK